MNKEMKKELFFAIIGCLLLIIVVIGMSFAVFTFSQKGNTLNQISTGTISFAYNEVSNGITITNAQPMTDAAGKIIVATDLNNGITQGYFDFTVSGSISGNRNITYEVYGMVDPASTMDSNYVKVYLTNGASSEVAMSGYNGAVVPTYGSLPAATNDSNGKRLYTANFSSNNISQTFRLRLWIADTYTVADTSKTFVMRVNVAAIDS